MQIQMLKLLVAVALFLVFSTGCQPWPKPHPQPTVLFAGLSFSLPAQPKVIAMPNGRESFLLFKYSDQPSRDYVAFSLEAAIDESCSSEEFFQTVVKPDQNTLCDPHAIMVFTQQFADQYPAELWHSAYYFQTNDQRRFVFIPLAADKLLKIDSDFFSKQQLRDLVEHSD